MHDLLAYALVLLLGLGAGCLAGVIGTGSSIILLPVLVFAFGPKQAVPIMAVASVMGNFSRVIAWRRDVNWRAVAAYAIPGAPAAALGARTLLALPSNWIDLALGVFFLAMIPFRHLQARTGRRLTLWQMALCGAVVGFVTGVVLSTGPLSLPVFAAYGLVGGAFLGTEAACSMILYLTKVLTFRSLGAMPFDIFAKGLLVGSSLMIGTYAGKSVVKRMSVHVFGHILDVVMFVAGIALIWNALR